MDYSDYERRFVDFCGEVIVKNFRNEARYVKNVLLKHKFAEIYNNGVRELFDHTFKASNTSANEIYKIIENELKFKDFVNKNKDEYFNILLEQLSWKRNYNISQGIIDELKDDYELEFLKFKIKQRSGINIHRSKRNKRYF